MKITVNLLDGPIGSCGFRSGKWRIAVDGKPGRIYASISHHLTLSEQREILTSRVLAGLESGRIEWIKSDTSG